MRKTLLTLTTLGAGLLPLAGCTPEGEAFGRGLVLGAAQAGANSWASEKGRMAANPNANNPQAPTVIYVQQKEEAKSSTYYIDKDLLDGSEKDLAEARAVYRVMLIDAPTIYNEKGREEYFKGCPEGFKTKYKAFLTVFGKWTKNRVSDVELMVEFRKVKKEALKEGVREKEQ